jgi:hypothetical protein
MNPQNVGVTAKLFEIAITGNKNGLAEGCQCRSQAIHIGDPMTRFDLSRF